MLAISGRALRTQGRSGELCSTASSSRAINDCNHRFLSALDSRECSAPGAQSRWPSRFPPATTSPCLYGNSRCNDAHREVSAG